MSRGCHVLLTTFLLVSACSNEPESTAAMHFGQNATLSPPHNNSATGQFRMPEIMGSGTAIADINKDGWPDILLVGGGSLDPEDPGSSPALSILLSQGSGGEFEDATVDLGLGELRAFGFGLAVADFDNDGDSEILITTLGQNILLDLQGDTYRNVATEIGLTEVSWSTSASFVDTNVDGYLDLYIANYLEWSPDSDLPCVEKGVRDYCNPITYPGVADDFYLNNGDGTFTLATEAAGLDLPEGLRGLGIVDLDIDKDGAPELYVANDGQRNLLFKNDGTGRFTEIGVTAGVAYDHYGTTRAGMGVDAGHVDASRQPSLFVGNFSTEGAGVWRHLGDNLFRDRGAESHLEMPTRSTLTFGLALVDADLDMDLDLILANGHVMKHIAQRQVGVTFAEPVQLFLNDGDGVFEDAQERTPNERLVGRGLASGDLNRDGAPDLVITENGGPARVWINEASSHFLQLRLIGRDSNRDGIGARIVASVDGIEMERRVRSGASYLSQSDLVASFGLGSHEGVDELTVYWPSGRVEQFFDVEGDRRLALLEGSRLLEEDP